jgi:hypothetical protein
LSAPPDTAENDNDNDGANTGQRYRDGRLLDEPHDSRLDVVGDPAWVGTLSK